MRAPTDLASKISSMAAGLGDGPLLVHSDLLRAGLPYNAPADRQGLLHAHWQTISEASQGRSVWMPAFNYRFPHNETHDVLNDTSEVGPFTEYFRTHVARWRTATPIFSFSGTGDMPPQDVGPTIDPFGSKSAYQHLVDLDGIDLAYGATMKTANIIHYAERQSGQPVYRYNKYFPGQVVENDGSTRDVMLLYHVRPWKTGLDYGHSRLQSDLIDSGICKAWQPGPLRYFAASARSMVKFWLERMAEDPLYMLDQQTRSWVEPKLEKLGRRFVLEDFEPAQELEWPLGARVSGAVVS